jgi:hypothetical protein
MLDNVGDRLLPFTPNIIFPTLLAAEIDQTKKKRLKMSLAEAIHSDVRCQFYWDSTLRSISHFHLIYHERIRQLDCVSALASEYSKMIQLQRLRPRFAVPPTEKF